MPHYDFGEVKNDNDQWGVLVTVKPFLQRFFLIFIIVFGLSNCASHDFIDRDQQQEDYEGRQDSGFYPYGKQPNWQGKDGKIRVALLLPLTHSRVSKLAQAMRQAAEMAMFEKANENFTLITRDTYGTPQGAAQAAQDAIAQGASLIIGPFFSTSVTAVTPIARQHNVSVLAFTNSLAVAGEGVFVMGYTPEQEVMRVVAYATAQGKQHFGVLAPNTPYGEVAIRALNKAVLRFGGYIEEAARYQQNQDPAQIVQAMKLDNLDAILVPEGGRNLIWVLSYLNHYREERKEALLEKQENLSPESLAMLDPVMSKDLQIIGTGLWNSPKTLKDPSLYGGWFAGIDQHNWQIFEGRYQQNFGNRPPKLASLCYDLVAMAAMIAKSPQGPDYSVNRLTDVTGFYGIDGNFRLKQDGTVERTLNVYEVTPRGIKLKSQARHSFL